MTQGTDIQEELRSTFEQLLAAMCCEPAACGVRLLSSARRPVLVLFCSKADYGAVLGKKQHTLKALQLLAVIAGQRAGVELELVLDRDGCANMPSVTSRNGHESVVNESWDSGPLEKLASLFCSSVLGPCRVVVEPVVKGTSRVTISGLAMDSDGRVDFQTWLPTEDEADSAEAALKTVFNCAGCLTGQRILVEVAM